LSWRPSGVTGVVVSRGPGSYTGLRVGIMSAKAFAYAIGCPILAIDTFAMLALQACVSSIEIIEDAQQERLYCQRFTLEGRLPKPATELRIVPFAEWRDSLSADVRVTGPGLYRFGERLRAEQLLPRDLWSPRLEALHQLALDRLARGEHDDLWRLEPLYARPSSAEEQWQRLGR
jgi:tRNA threonylcarbamoyladenosine biosynthesis protein TsaB